MAGNARLGLWWHPSRNLPLQATDVMSGCKTKMWWRCEEHGHEWQATPESLARPPARCPVCQGRKVLVGFNDLASQDPGLAAQWHPHLNGGLTPEQVTRFSGRKVWWRCEGGHEWRVAVSGRSGGSGCPACAGLVTVVGVNDLASQDPVLAAQWHPTRNAPLTPDQVTRSAHRRVWWQCEHGHEWQATINNRNIHRGGCPVCVGKTVLAGFNDLATVHPSVAEQWHPTRNGNLAPQQVSRCSGRRVWWQCEHGHEWQTTISSRTSSGSGCPTCSGLKVWSGRTDLATVAPDIAAQWHPTRNGDLMAKDVPAHVGRAAWWCCEVGHAWRMSIAERVDRGAGCPVCSSRQLLTGFNDLATLAPDVAAQWHPTRNAPATPEQVIAAGSFSAWWVCGHGHTWRAGVNRRVAGGAGCPVCANKFIVAGVNDLATTRPDLAAEWDQALNEELKPEEVGAGSHRRVWWRCLELKHVWRSSVKDRSARGYSCPTCSGRRIMAGFNDLATRRPDLAAQWHPTRNDGLSPDQVTAGSHQLAWWRCDAHGHEWRAEIKARVQGTGCPVCDNKQILTGFNDLATLAPEIAAQWHPTRNGTLTPHTVPRSSSAIVAWWQCSVGHEWPASINSRAAGNGCPVCANRQVLVGFNDLASQNPEMAAQWHPTRNGTLTPQQLTLGSSKQVWWRCDAGHEWRMSVMSRVGPSCAACSLSAIEEAMRAALLAAGHTVRRGLLPDVRHGNGRVMHCDAIDEAHRLVIEYDGAYWHAKREERDRMKTVRMLEAGWRVIRVRHCHPSYPLHSLNIDHPNYLEITDPGTGVGQDTGFMPRLLWGIGQLTSSQPMLV